jgi:hypothetical protein
MAAPNEFRSLREKLLLSEAQGGYLFGGLVGILSVSARFAG